MELPSSISLSASNNKLNLLICTEKYSALYYLVHKENDNM